MPAPGESARERISPALWIFVLAFFLGLYQLIAPSGYGFGEGWEPVAIARELAKTGQFANPFAAGPSGPTAVIPPVYPLYLAALIKLLGYTPAFAFTATLLSILFQALHAALMPRVSLILFGTPAPGVVAGVLSSFAFRLIPQWDANFTACGIVLFLVCASLVTKRASALTGAGAALLLLASASSILITGPWLLYLFWRNRPGFTRLMLAAAALIIVTFPWMLRNYLRLGAFAVKDNFGYTALASNSDCSLSTLADGPASTCMDLGNPNKNPAEWQLIRRIGEVRYDALRRADLRRWIESHPSAFARLTGARIAGFWFPELERPRYTTVTVWLSTLLSLGGFVLLFRRRSPAIIYLAGVCLLYPPLYYIVLIDVRYRYPVLWVTLLSAGYFACALAESARFGRGAPLVQSGE